MVQSISVNHTNGLNAQLESKLNMMQKREMSIMANMAGKYQKEIPITLVFSLQLSTGTRRVMLHRE